MRESRSGYISQRYRGKHFSAFTREAFLITEKWEASTELLAFHSVALEAFHITEKWDASTVLLAFRSAVAGSISHRQEGREASAYAGISQRCCRKHFTSSKWTGSISICWYFTALAREAFHSVVVEGKHQLMLGRICFEGGGKRQK